MKRRDALLCGASAAWSLVGAAGACGPSNIADRRRQLLWSWGTRTLLPLYRECEQRLVTLDERALELSTEPTPDTLEAARAAWSAARQPWKQAEVFAFGPYSDDPFRIGANIDFWPMRPETVQGVLAGSDALGAETAASLGAAAKGLPVVEYLLFDPELDIVAEMVEAPRRGEYLSLLTQDLLVNVRALAKAWDPEHGNYLAQLTDAGRGSTLFESLTAALGSVVNQIGFLIEQMRGEKLARPLGTGGASSAQPDKVESRFSGRSIDDMLDNLSGLERSFFGRTEAEELGLHDYLAYRGKDLSALVRSRSQAARDALQRISVPLTEAVVEQRLAVSQALASLADLQRVFQVDVLSALSLSVAFGGSDGD